MQIRLPSARLERRGGSPLAGARCKVCAKPLSRHQHYAGGVCGAWRCRERLLDDALAAHREKAATALGVASAQRYGAVVVPTRAAPVVPLPGARRGRFREHLEALAASVAGEQPGPAPGEVERAAEYDEPDPATRDRLGRICAVCRGACCYGGGDRAFLDADTLRRYQAAHPLARRAALVAAYLEHLPAATHEGSCVFHAGSGCALPRGMRPPVCNAYACRGLKQARWHLVENGSRALFVAVRDDNRIVRSAFVDDAGIRDHPPAGPATGAANRAPPPGA